MTKTRKLFFLTLVLAIGIAVSGITLHFITIDDDSVTIGVATWHFNPDYDLVVQRFKLGLKEFGYVEGENLQFLIHDAQANEKAQRQIIQDFVDKDVDLIFTLTTPGTLIAKEITQEIPIVFSIVTYPVETQIIETLEHSGNNLAGTRNYIPIEKHFQLIKDISKPSTIGFVHRTNEPNSVIQLNEMNNIANQFNVNVFDLKGNNLIELEESILDSIESVDVFFLSCDTLVQNGGDLVTIKISKAYLKPTFSCSKNAIVEGAVAGNIVSFESLGHMSGQKAGLILEGADPNDLITQHPHDDLILINFHAAQLFHLEIPQYLQFSANEII